MQYVFLKLHCIKINDKCVTNQGKKTRHTHQLVKMSEKKKAVNSDQVRYFWPTTVFIFFVISRFILWVWLTHKVCPPRKLLMCMGKLGLFSLVEIFFSVTFMALLGYISTSNQDLFLLLTLVTARLSHNLTLWEKPRTKCANPWTKRTVIFGYYLWLLLNEKWTKHSIMLYSFYRDFYKRNLRKFLVLGRVEGRRRRHFYYFNCSPLPSSSQS